MLPNAAMRILNQFYAENTLAFTVLCEGAGYPTDLGGYYIRQLVTKGYLDKAQRGQYALTVKGKQYLAVHYGKKGKQEMPRSAVIIVPHVKDGYYALQRTVQPFVGKIEWPAAVIEPGEPLMAAASRVINSRLGLDAPAQYRGLFRRIDMYGEFLFDDKLFFVFDLHVFENPASTSSTGKIIKVGNHQDNSLNYSPAFFDILSFTTDDGTNYTERTYLLEAADFQVSLDE